MWLLWLYLVDVEEVYTFSVIKVTSTCFRSLYEQTICGWTFDLCTKCSVNIAKLCNDFALLRLYSLLLTLCLYTLRKFHVSGSLLLLLNKAVEVTFINGKSIKFCLKPPLQLQSRCSTIFLLFGMPSSFFLNGKLIWSCPFTQFCLSLWLEFESLQ